MAKILFETVWSSKRGKFKENGGLTPILIFFFIKNLFLFYLLSLSLSPTPCLTYPSFSRRKNSDKISFLMRPNVYFHRFNSSTRGTQLLWSMFHCYSSQKMWKMPKTPHRNRSVNGRCSYLRLRFRSWMDTVSSRLPLTPLKSKGSLPYPQSNCESPLSEINVSAANKTSGFFFELPVHFDSF